MSFVALKDRHQIASARAALSRQGVSFVEPNWKRWMRTHGWIKGVNVGDWLKSWDILLTVQHIEQHNAKDARIVDIGAFSCELLPILKRKGFVNLIGVDLDSRITGMPFADTVRYLQCDFMRMDLESASCDSVTAISVIEHGYQEDRFLAEMSRIIRPGGSLLLSFDYWPSKLDTSNIRIFDMTWTIFSSDDVKRMITQAGAYGFQPFGDSDFAAPMPTMHYYGQDYTFGWLALKKA